MRRIFQIALLCIFAIGLAQAQPILRLNPHRVEFENLFKRLKNVYFVNDGDQPLIIDSLTYTRNFYFARFNQRDYIPFTIYPGDSVKMDCILSGYTFIDSNETTDTMFVYNTGSNPVVNLNIQIDYSDDNFRHTTINGNISDGTSPVENADVFFFYNGSYILNSVKTDVNGNYSANIPAGNYLVAAKKDSFYVTFFGQQLDPFNASFINGVRDSTETADINIVRMLPTGISVSGQVLDSLSQTPLYKGIVVVRNGTHTPTKSYEKITGTPADSGFYTAFVDANGNYTINNIIQPDYYFVQSFSDYFVPTYYFSRDSSAVLWQQADSIYLNTNLSAVDIYMPRDSSIGGGTIQGTILTGNKSAFDLSDIILYAQSLDYNAPPFNFAISKSDGNYSIPFLPFGNYRILAQKIGYDNVFSTDVTIDQNNTQINGIDILYNITSVGDNVKIPDKIELYQNYPNPFNPSTTIKYSLPIAENIQIRVVNILGQLVSIIKNGYQSAGMHEVVFNGDNLSSGVYFVLLTTGNKTLTKKIMLLK